MKISAFLILTCLSIYTSAQKINKQFIPKQPYFKYVIPNKKIDSITFYLSEFAEKKENLPLIIYIQGSGKSSLFNKKDDGRLVPTSGHATWNYEIRDKAKFLIIEKPGINFLNEGNGDNPIFDKNFSLQSWSKRIEDIIKMVIKKEKIDQSKIMVVGHSEGGIVAAKVAKDLANLISNVVILAGEGPSQLYSLYNFAETRSSNYFNDPTYSKNQLVDSLLRTWKNILENPNSIEKKFLGFTYLKWSSFLKTSVIDQLNAYNGKILIIQGDADKNVLPESAKVAYISLLSKGKNVEFEMIPKADHSFNIINDDKINGWQEVARKTIKWFLNN